MHDLELWEQTRKLILFHYHRFWRKETVRKRAKMAGVEWEDIEQTAWLAFSLALKGYKPEEGSFQQYLGYAAKAVFFETLGIRTRRQARDPLCLAESLNKPIGGEKEDLFLEDVIPDPLSFSLYEEMEQADYIARLHRVLEEGLKNLNKREEIALRGIYYQGKTQGKIAEEIGVSRSFVHQIQGNALQKMRKPSFCRKLEAYREGFIVQRATKSIGFGAWKSGGSVEERIVEKLERLEKEIKQNKE